MELILISTLSLSSSSHSYKQRPIFSVGSNYQLQKEQREVLECLLHRSNLQQIKGTRTVPRVSEPHSFSPIIYTRFFAVIKFPFDLLCSIQKSVLDFRDIDVEPGKYLKAMMKEWSLSCMKPYVKTIVLDYVNCIVFWLLIYTMQYWWCQFYLIRAWAWIKIQYHKWG